MRISAIARDSFRIRWNSQGGAEPQWSGSSATPRFTIQL